MAKDITGSDTIIVSLDGESVNTVAVKGINNSLGVNINVAQIGLILNKVHGGGKITALRVRLNADGEIEFVAASADLVSSVKAEIADHHSAVNISRGHKAKSGCGIIDNSVVVSHLDGSTISNVRLNSNRHVPAVNLHSTLKIVSI